MARVAPEPSALTGQGALMQGFIFSGAKIPNFIEETFEKIFANRTPLFHALFIQPLTGHHPCNKGRYLERLAPLALDFFS